MILVYFSGEIRICVCHRTILPERGGVLAALHEVLDDGLALPFGI